MAFTRRELLQLMASAGAGFSLLPLIEACGAGPSTATPSGSADEGQIACFDIQYAEDFFRKELDVFAQQFPKVQVNYQTFANPTYNQTMAQNFVGGVAMDALFVRDSTVASWVQYLRPLDDMPKVDEYKKDMFPYLLDAYTVNGKLYGMPRNATWDAFLYNAKMLNDAGFSSPPKTWDELTQQALAMKKAKVVDYPIVLWLKNFPGNNLDWWDLVYAHGGELFDKDNQPLFPDKDPTSADVLNWIIDGVYNTKIINPAITELDYQGAVDTFSSARGAFMMMPISLISNILDPTKSKVASVMKAAITPGPSAAKYPGHSLGYTTMYSMYAKTKNPLATWMFLQFMGGKDKNGTYYNPTHMWTDISLAYAYQSMSKDSVVAHATEKYMDPQVFAMGNKMAKTKQAGKAAWFADWDVYHVGKLQDAITKKVSVRQALQDSADKARRLAKGG